MLVKQTLPTLFITTSAVDVHLRIYPDDHFYKAELQISGVKPQRFRIGLTPHDVEELNLELQEAIEEVSNRCEEAGGCSELLSELANAGKSAFNRIFAEGGPRETIYKALEIISTKTGVTIEISSENFFIPWELLYHETLDEPVDASNFWGMRYIIARTLIQDNRPGDMVSPIIQSSCPEVGLIAYKELEYVAGKEIPALQVLDQKKQIHLSCLPSLDPSQHRKGLKVFGGFLCGELDIVHLACHAYVMTPLNHSYLHISDRFDITMQDFHAYGFKIKSNPLVILNACRTGTISPLYTSNWASLFWEYGARGVLATEFRVPDWFAAAFVERLYQCLLSGMPIGESLWDTRCYFWKEKSNPLGLAYALYSPFSIRIANSD